MNVHVSKIAGPLFKVQNSNNNNLEIILPLTKRPRLVSNLVGSWGVDNFLTPAIKIGTNRHKDNYFTLFDINYILLYIENID